MEEDRELLEFAAKAAGIRGHFGLRGSTSNFWLENNDGESVGKQWNPLTDDGDALRLAVKLENLVDIGRGGCHVRFLDRSFVNHINELGDPYAATRRAIVRAAAEIGKEMK